MSSISSSLLDGPFGVFLPDSQASTVFLLTPIYLASRFCVRLLLVRIRFTAVLSYFFIGSICRVKVVRFRFLPPVLSKSEITSSKEAANRS